MSEIQVVEEKVLVGELVEFEKKSLEVSFSDGTMAKVLERIKEVAIDFVPDASTEKGRKEMISRARKVASSKTFLDDLGKSITADWRKKTDIINGERKKIVTFLDNLRDEIRKPVTEFEEIEKRRVEAIQKKMEELKLLTSSVPTNSAEAMEMILRIEAFVVDASFQEFMAIATQLKEQALNLLKPAHDGFKAKEEAQEKWRKAQEEAKRKQIEEEAIKQAEEKARIEREKLEKEKEEQIKRMENEKLESERKAREEKERLEKEKALAEQREKEARERAEREKVESEKRLAQEKENARIAKEEAERKAEADKQKAIEDERKRIEAENEKQRIAKEEAERKKKEEDEARARNEAHRNKIKSDAAKAIAKELTVSPDYAMKVISLIENHKVPNVSIKF